ncbi:hypothetical protein FRC12_017310 [Ceratobasidium sp. 428]|nr:hypothetical protein FRC12_017310 [Ceratobasidium sp. 428]
MLFVSRYRSTGLIARSDLWKVARRGAAVRGPVLGKDELNRGSKKDDNQADALDQLSRTEVPYDFDLRAQRIRIFDTIRYPSSVTSTPPGIRPKLDWAKTFLLDKFRSIYGLRKAYKIGLIAPPQPSILSLLRLSSPAFTSKALSLYTQMNDALARGDERSLARACSEEQFDKLKQRIRARPKGQTIEWKIDEPSSRVDVLSVACQDAWSTQKPEDYCMQALVRFDTRQKIAVYGPGRKLISGDPNKTVRVRELLVLEKKNWVAEQDWLIRAPKT